MIGMGLLAAGSGAAFSSATFQNSVDADADFRVVVEDNLIAEAGSGFRDGEDFNPGDGGLYRDIGSDSLFAGGDGEIDGSLDELDPEDLPAVGANDGANSNLAFEVATKIDEEEEFPGFLRIRNDGTEDKDVGITFNVSDTVADGGGPLTRGLVETTYQFDIDETIISPNPGGNGAGDDEPANYITIPSGATENVRLTVDTTGQNSDDLTDGANLDDLDPFSQDGEHAAIDLVDQIVIGTRGEQS